MSFGESTVSWSTNFIKACGALAGPSSIGTGYLKHPVTLVKSMVEEGLVLCAFVERRLGCRSGIQYPCIHKGSLWSDLEGGSPIWVTQALDH